MNFKNIHIGQMIEQKIVESGIEISRVCSFLKCTENVLEEIYQSDSINTELLLKLCKLTSYDFFRIYSHHLILYSPPSRPSPIIIKKATTLPTFKKNIYTMEIIDFMLDMIYSEKKTKKQIIEEYKIPKTTLYKWIKKYQK
ncbi:transposase [Chryseobacterium sp. R2ACT005]|uniref:transposase n=1 Tax=Chryseobacterium sp. R2ACT005 TaxID=3416668 RepID=UPI003CEC3A74